MSKLVRVLLGLTVVYVAYVIVGWLNREIVLWFYDNGYIAFDSVRYVKGVYIAPVVEEILKAIAGVIVARIAKAKTFNDRVIIISTSIFIFSLIESADYYMDGRATIVQFFMRLSVTSIMHMLGALLSTTKLVVMPIAMVFHGVFNAIPNVVGGYVLVYVALVIIVLWLKRQRINY